MGLMSKMSLVTGGGDGLEKLGRIAVASGDVIGGLMSWVWLVASGCGLFLVWPRLGCACPFYTLRWA